MTDIVINACFGGFGLSEDAIKRYAEIKGITLYIEPNKNYPTALGPTYWVVPEGERVRFPVDGRDWYEIDIEERKEMARKYSEQKLDASCLKRDDETLVMVVRELGERANDRFSKLKVVTIPPGVDWVIEEYDGNETIAEAHRTWD